MWPTYRNLIVSPYGQAANHQCNLQAVYVNLYLLFTMTQVLGLVCLLHHTQNGHESIKFNNA